MRTVFKVTVSDSHWKLKFNKKIRENAKKITRDNKTRTEISVMIMTYHIMHNRELFTDVQRTEKHKKKKRFSNYLLNKCPKKVIRSCFSHIIIGEAVVIWIPSFYRLFLKWYATEYLMRLITDTPFLFISFLCQINIEIYRWVFMHFGKTFKWKWLTEILDARHSKRGLTTK